MSTKAKLPTFHEITAHVGGGNTAPSLPLRLPLSTPSGIIWHFFARQLEQLIWSKCRLFFHPNYTWVDNHAIDPGGWMVYHPGNGSRARTMALCQDSPAVCWSPSTVPLSSCSSLPVSLGSAKCVEPISPFSPSPTDDIEQLVQARACSVHSLPFLLLDFTSRLPPPSLFSWYIAQKVLLS